MSVSIKWKSVLQLAAKYKYAVLILFLGLLFMLLPSGRGSADKKEAQVQQKVSSFSLSEEEKKLEGMLSSMEGVGRVKVALTIKSGSESVYALDQSESLRNAGTSDNAAYEKDSDSKPMVVSSDAGGESPVTVKEYLPEYRGALIICDGAADEKIKLEITEAVCALTGITYDNISVIKMKS